MLGTYLVLALLGLYADWRLLSHFDVNYLAYAGLGDYLLAPLRVLPLTVDPGFMLLFVIFATGLTLLAAGGRYVLRAILELWRGPAQRSAGATLPFVEPFKVQETFRSDLRALLTRPVRLVPVLGVAAGLAIGINAALDTQDLRTFAKLVQHAYAKDRYQQLGPPYARYELVSVRTPSATEPLRHLVRLRPTGSHGFYYDVLDDELVVVPGSTILSELADADLARSAASATARVELPIGPPEALGQDDAGGAGGPPPEASSGLDEVVALLPRSDGGRAAERGSEPTRSSPAPEGGAVGQPSLVWEGGAVSESARQAVVLALDDSVAQRDPESAAATGAAPPPETLAPGPGIAAIEASMRASQGTLEGLKSYLQQVEGSFGDIHQVIEQLDGRLGQIDQALGRLATQQADQPADPVADPRAAEPTAGALVAYADCADLTAGQPLEFGPNDATLSLKAIGWLFQSRRQLTAPRSPERQQWLVIEGHADRSGQNAVEDALPLQRAGAVRDFLQSELGIQAEALKVVGAAGSGPGGRFVNLYDCLERASAAEPAAPITAEAEPITTEAAPITTAAEPVTTTAEPITTAQEPVTTAAQPVTTAAEPITTAQEPIPGVGEEAVSEAARVRPAVWEAGDEAGGLSALLVELGPQPREQGLLVTVPGDQLFETNSYQIRAAAYDVLGKIGEALVRAPERDAVIVGHSDEIGEADYNQSLSEQRAGAVRDFLVDKFRINADRLAVEGRGEGDPIASNATRAGRKANRRIEVLLLE